MQIRLTIIYRFYIWAMGALVLKLVLSCCFDVVLMLFCFLFAPAPAESRLWPWKLPLKAANDFYILFAGGGRRKHPLQQRGYHDRQTVPPAHRGGDHQDHQCKDEAIIKSRNTRVMSDRLDQSLIINVRIRWSWKEQKYQSEWSPGSEFEIGMISNVRAKAFSGISLVGL